MTDTGEGRGHDVFETDSGTKGGFHFGDGLENRGMPFDARGSRTRTVPGIATRPKSLRRRSTIM